MAWLVVNGRRWYPRHLGGVDFSCRPMKAVIPAKAGIQWGLHSLEPGNSTPHGLLLSRSAIVAAWIPAFAGMTTLQMTPLPRRYTTCNSLLFRVRHERRCTIGGLKPTGGRQNRLGKNPFKLSFRAQSLSS